MITKTVTYTQGNKEFEGYIAYKEDGTEKKPLVLVAHAWFGLNGFAKKKAEMLAEMGYIGFAADVYGKGVLATNSDEAKALMAPLFQNRNILRDRIVTAFNTASEHPLVDKKRRGAIGFCFGGLTVIELLRSGVDIQGIVSFHGLLGYQLQELQATPAQPEKMKGAALIFHGYEDPLVSKEDIKAIQQEFTEAKIDWQFFVFGNAAHAFTNPDAHSPESGMMYNPLAEKRSMHYMKDFFKEKFMS